MAVLQDTGVTHTWCDHVTAALDNLLHALVGSGDQAHSLDGFPHHLFCECITRQSLFHESRSKTLGLLVRDDVPIN